MQGTIGGGAEALSGRTIVLGVSGGIAAYKAAELTRLLRKAGATVHVILTDAATRFVTPLSLQTLSGNPVGTDLFDLTQESQIGHISLADRADLLLIAPATADVLARLSLGLANDLLTTVALACRAPLLLAPAMNVNMWAHPAVQDHVGRLRGRGASIVGPDSGDLACGWVGAGRMAEPAEIAAQAVAILTAPAARSLLGRHVLISAGPTYEAIDPVRFIGNRSTGKMGFALAAEAARRGARVTLVAGPVSLPTPIGVTRLDVESAAQMADAVFGVWDAGGVDCAVMTAAVADFRPAHVAPVKLKKRALGDAPRIDLTPTVDVLAALGRRRAAMGAPLLVGFAAETQDVATYAAGKLRDKRCDVIVANDVSEAGSGFGTDTNRVTLFVHNAERPDSPTVDAWPQLPKGEVASRLWDRLSPLLPARAVPSI